MKLLLTISAAVAMSACNTTAPTSTLSPSQVSTSQPFSIKDYTLGQVMTSCPADTVTQQEKGEMTFCILGPTTYATAPVKNISLMLAESQVIAVSVDFNERGQYANSTVLNALVQRYGEASGSKKHINQYAWIRRNILLMFDGWKGSLMLIDNDKFNAATAKAAKSSKKDM